MSRGRHGCSGLWRRILLVEADGSRDTSTDIVWLQGITCYVDSRGFAGRLSRHDDIFEWHRAIDLLPPSGTPDVGRMHWEADILVETGVHADYIEHWVREDIDRAPCWAVTARGPAGEDALLLRVGTLFGWANPSQVIVGTVGGAEWTALGVRMDDGELVADGLRWTVKETEGVVNT
ncbi:hypothetical protein SAMN04489835_5150 [Mycolicibacterium rutilum]|uniref:Uncharacterized protein n=1 Tax=Mycolicibacterium rutilum TaxID=370526 RepID=A0A1H6LR68_MYCRU|nr:hypothetical protein [Mycolicibacterium rutilum]SEH87473.1 hypothetical protein SAMN04489835_5150 [Mycolicibacterium rutilum]